MIEVVKRELAVMLDASNVSYLQLGKAANGHSVLILNNGRTVDVIEMDPATVKSRHLQVVQNADLLNGIKTLLRPFNKEVKISKPAETELNKLLNDKELIATMTPATAAKPAAVSATRGPKPVKVGAAKASKAKTNAAANRPGRHASEHVVKLLKMPPEGEIRGYALNILETLKENGKEMNSNDLVKKLKTDTANKNGQMAVWTFHRAKLEKAGYIRLTPVASE